MASDNIKDRINKKLAKSEGTRKSYKIAKEYYGDPRLRNEERIKKDAEEFKDAYASPEEAKASATDDEDFRQARRLQKRALKVYTKEAMKKRGIHEVFELAYSDLSENIKTDLLRSIVEKADYLNESFINESNEVNPMVEFVDAISRSDITEEALDSALDLAFESFTAEEVYEVTEDFIALSVRKALDEALSKEHMEKRNAQRKQAAANVISKRSNELLSSNVSPKRLIKGSDENKALGKAKQRFDAARGLIKPTAMDKLKGAANKVWKNTKRATNKVLDKTVRAPQAHDVALDMLRKRYPDSTLKAKSGSKAPQQSAPVGNKATQQSAPAGNKSSGAALVPSKSSAPVAKSKTTGTDVIDLTKGSDGTYSEKDSSEEQPNKLKRIGTTKPSGTPDVVKAGTTKPSGTPDVIPMGGTTKAEPAKEEKPATGKGKKGGRKKKDTNAKGQLKLDLGTKEGKKRATKKVKETTEKVAKEATKSRVTKAPKNVKIDVPKTEETSKDAKAEKKELAKAYVKETSKAKPNEEKVKEIVNKTKKAENKEGFLKQEEKKKAKGEKGTIKLASKIKASKEAKKEEAPKVEVKSAKVEAPKKEIKPAKEEAPKAQPKKEAKPKAQPKVEAKEEKAPAPQEPAKKEELSKEDRKIQRELDRQAKEREAREAKNKADNKAELERLKGSTDSKDIKRRNELESKLKSSEAPKAQEEKSKISDEERTEIREKINKNQKRLEELSKINTPQARAQVATIKKYLDKYNKKLNESLVEAMDLLEANLSEESFFEILEMMVAEPKSKADRFKEMMAEKHII